MRGTKKMSYEAIARKWRPMSFDEISGQGHVTRTLVNALKRDRIHHAYLFTGPRGVGKTTAARALARCLNCESGPTDTPCQDCASCREILAGNSPDVVEIDGASNNSVDDIRDLRDSVQYLPSRGGRRVFIIDEVHMLSKGAFNALLKTLEEPPKHVVFVFATTEPKKIPDTVLSRVQRFDFKRISEKVVASRLRIICDSEGVEISDVSLLMIARAGEGSMRDAQSLLDQVIAFGGAGVGDAEVGEILGLVDRSLLYSMLEGLLNGQPEKALMSISTVYEHGHELSQFSSEFLGLLRNAALIGLSPSSRNFLDIPEEEKERLDGIVKGVTADVFTRYFDVMLETHDAVARSSSPRMVLEMAVARMASTRRVQPVDVLLQKLSNLERRMRGAGAAPKVGRHGSAPRETTTKGERSSSSKNSSSEPEPRDDLRPTLLVGGAGGSAAIAMDQSIAPVAGRDAVEERHDPTVESSVHLTLVSSQDEPPVSKKPSDSNDHNDLFLLFLSRVRELGGAFRTLSENSANGGYQGGKLRVLFTSDRTLKRGTEIIREPQVIDIAKELFDGFIAMEPLLRAKGDSTQTVREKEQSDRREYEQLLWKEAESDPAIKLICKTLGGVIERVTPIEEQ